MFTVRLPVPPSTNELFVTFRQRGGIERAKTKTYKAWIEAAGWALNVQRPQPIKGHVSLDISVPLNRRRDLDNHLKALLDLLVGHSLIEDDRKVDDLRIQWHVGEKEAVVQCKPMFTVLGS
jgi:Holliday junction resolvase RusA-like endonuclease